MEAIYWLLPVALLMSAFGLACFVWAIRNGQFDDLEGPAWKLIYDNDTRSTARARQQAGPGREAGRDGH